MPKNTTLDSSLTELTIASNSDVSNKSDNIDAPEAAFQPHKEFVLLQREINQLKNTLCQKYEALEKLKSDISDRPNWRAKINPKAKKLNRLNLNLPNFLVIGVQKGGTTWLHENLKRHPQIFLPEGKKELEFFSYYDRKIAQEGLKGYLKHFNQFSDVIKTEPPIAIGEATPSYFWSMDSERKWTNPPKYFNDRIPQSVHNLLGSDLKLILCLRDPVERAISAYFHHIKRDRIDYQNQSILDVGHLFGIIDMGFYNQHLNAWLKKFSLDNFKVLIYERDIKQNKQETVKDICNFLSVDHQLFPTSTNLNKYHNRGLKYTIQPDGVYLINPDSEEKTIVIREAELQQLREIYRTDYLSLQETLNTDLSKYWKFD